MLNVTQISSSFSFFFFASLFFVREQKNREEAMKR